MIKFRRSAQNTHIKKKKVKYMRVENSFFQNLPLCEFFLSFLTGAVLYYAIEMLWRGRSHWSMAIVGGICFYLIYLMYRLFPSMPIVLGCILGGVIITAVELGAGEIVNLRLGWNVWDYSQIPLNYKGQICLLFSLFWCLLSFPAIGLAKFYSNYVFGG